jgi:hypothetical protein
MRAAEETGPDLRNTCNASGPGNLNNIISQCCSPSDHSEPFKQRHASLSHCLEFPRSSDPSGSAADLCSANGFSLACPNSTPSRANPCPHSHYFSQNTPNAAPTRFTNRHRSLVLWQSLCPLQHQIASLPSSSWPHRDKPLSKRLRLSARRRTLDQTNGSRNFTKSNKPTVLAHSLYMACFPQRLRIEANSHR